MSLCTYDQYSRAVCNQGYDGAYGGLYLLYKLFERLRDLVIKYFRSIHTTQENLKSFSQSIARTILSHSRSMLFW